jgi:hypothetical protein
VNAGRDDGGLTGQPDLVFVLLLNADPKTAGARFGERVGETALGIGIAYLFGLLLPTSSNAGAQRVSQRRRRTDTTTRSRVARRG